MGNPSKWDPRFVVFDTDNSWVQKMVPFNDTCLYPTHRKNPIGGGPRLGLGLRRGLVESLVFFRWPSPWGEDPSKFIVA